MCTCAVCLTNKGIKSKCLMPITPSVCEKIQDNIWPNFDSDLNVCSNCRRNLFSLNKGETAYLSNWFESISKVLLYELIITIYIYIYIYICIYIYIYIYIVTILSLHKTCCYYYLIFSNKHIFVLCTQSF